ncbi:MAG: aspartate--tRNA(Asn) ligase [Parcubacteria group bacterium]|nr:aspartate--tRNA(Asn) ligase [Parcubacteria group bacterium]
MRIMNEQVMEKIGQSIAVAGWVSAARKMGKVVFLDITDRSGKLQIVCIPAEMDESKDRLSSIKSHTVIEVFGIVQKRDQKQVNAKISTGSVELLAKSVKILSHSEGLPFDIDDKLNLETYLDFMPITLRSDRAKAVFSVQTEIVHAFREFLRHEKFMEFQAPKIVAQAAEGGANVYKLDYFGHNAFLAQSPQIYKQIMVGVYERVFTIGNVYRAEPHATSRHLNEYTSMDLEFGFIKDHTDVMKLENRLLSFISQHLQKTCSREFSMFEASIPAVPQEIPSLKLKEAQEIIKKEYGEDCTSEPDLEPHQEMFIADFIKKTRNSEFVFITHYPTSKRPFYTYPDEADPEYTKSFDLLFRGLEITTGGQRIHEYEQLLANLKKWNYNPVHFEFMLQCFRYGMPPEGGLAIGLERLTAKYLGIDNVKWATLFPRDLNRIDTKLSQ